MNSRHIERNGSTYTAVCRSSDVLQFRGRKEVLDEFTEVALFRVDGECHAVSNICPHQHSALIADGVVENDTVICPMHGWQFNIRDGAEVNQRGRIKTFEVIEEDGMVYIAWDKNDIPAWMRD